MKTNSLISLTKKQTTKLEDSYNYYIFCNKCDTLLGFELKNKKNGGEDDNNNEDLYFYFIKKNIKERNDRNIIINLISFKENISKSIKEELNIILKEINNFNIKINLTSLTKQNFEDFSQFYKKCEFDFTFVIHKMEGRIFLLGKNGYFNSVENCLLKKQNSNLYFILISNEVNEDENKKIIEELIKKGGEERLEKYYKNDRIIFIDNYEIKEDINKKKDWFIGVIKEIFGNDKSSNNYYHNYYMPNERNEYIADKRKIDNMIEYLNNQEKKHTGCFS